MLFGFLAGFTSLELVTGVIILPQRQTALVAKQAAEVDLLTGGRFRLGVGIGWNPVEYEALGRTSPTGPRARRADRAAAAGSGPSRSVTYEGAHDASPAAGLAPLPVQRPIPIWIGGSRRPAYRRIGRLADGWFPQVRPASRSTRPGASSPRRPSAAGRDPATIGMEGRVSWAGDRADSSSTRSALGRGRRHPPRRQHHGRRPRRGGRPPRGAGPGCRGRRGDGRRDWATWSAARSSSRSSETCMPLSMPAEHERRGAPSGRTGDTCVIVVTPSTSSKVVVTRAASSSVARGPLVELGVDQPVRAGDLLVLAVEPDLEAVVLDDVAPLAADAQVDVALEPLGGLEAPPALDELGRRLGLEEQRGGASNTRRDEDLGVRGR